MRPSRLHHFSRPRGNAATHAREASSRGGRSPLVWGFLVALGVGGGAFVLGALSTLSELLVYIGIALFLSLAIEPVMRWIISKGVRRGLALLATVLATLLITAGLITLVLPEIVQQFDSFLHELPTITAAITSSPLVADLNVDLAPLIDQVVSFLADPDQLLSIGGGLLSVGRGLFTGVSGVLTVTVLTLYFSATLPTIVTSVSRAIPASRRARTVKLVDDIFLSVGRYVAGQLGLAALNALVVFAVLTPAGASAPLLLALVAFIGALIPVVGTIVAYAAIVVSMLFISPAAALIVGIVLLVYAQLEAHVITPRVMSRTMSIPGSLVIISVFAGAALGGVLGALVAVPIAASGVLVFERVVAPTQARR
ncbi:AI-2E family transporter [Rathayibacter sp. ZW T2_19]|uniref:AI-2E family transporter n=1 Tax=Rathayibacter rubneri TaxID=2950106 RepID=A0A9X2DVA3_9MICO|nr:AI-2E family transporter [Rathayibacter rubneri]MCM6761154.1 AI-2E family transporter [Rathayibacter rubneri]